MPFFITNGLALMTIPRRFYRTSTMNLVSILEYAARTAMALSKFDKGPVARALDAPAVRLI